MSREHAQSDLLSRLLQLQSRFTWDLQHQDLQDRDLQHRDLQHRDLQHRDLQDQDLQHQDLQDRDLQDRDLQHQDLDSLSTRLQEHIKLQLGQPGAAALSYSFLAYVRYHQLRPEEAESLLNQSEEMTRECFGEESERRLVVTYGDLAWLKYHTGDYTQAPQYCQRVEDILEKYPTGSPSVLLPEVYGEKGWTYLKFSFKYYSKAIDCFHKALELQPDDREWNAGLAIALYRKESSSLQKGSETESLAIKQLRRAVEINPADGVLLSMLAIRLAADKHQRPEAKDLIERALSTDPDNPHITRYVAKYLRNQGDVDDSIALLQQALQRTSESAFISHQLALCYKRKKIAEHKGNKTQRWRAECIRHLNKAVELKPSFVLALADLALMYGEEKNFIRANELFQQALQILPGSCKSIQQFFHRCYGDFHFYHSKQEADAIAHYSEGLLPRHTWDQKQCAKKLTQIAERRLEADDSDGQALALLALIAQTDGDKKKAEQLYEKALDCDSNNQDFLSALLELRLELADTKN
ncbi:interferon-induced protein with tetratricopeptide repeats 5-like [Scomber japonicus]|uniref:interferon-induced protein with tetratricopeptide repeats 5-like n=1 Tax=Scomber japonicus TaxID=13676 RepID=UPI002305A21B|nr:interferon-induced protein with tetratricopeptide repeats 5-like [Scomber japonicus]